MDEETLYSDSNLSVTTARVVIGGTTYAIRNITSVKMTWKPAKKGCAILLLISAFHPLFLAIYTFSRRPIDSLIPLVAGVIILALAIYWLRRCRPVYHVVLATASGETHAFSSKHRGYIEEIIARINDAIIRCN